jgi:DoxX-like family
MELSENPMSTIGRGRRIAGWVLTGLLTASLLVSASGKLFGMAQVVEMMQKWGLGNHLLLIGAGELVSALLFAIPKTHSLGVLLLSAYMGGAIVTHMQHDEPFVIQSVYLALIWVAGYLRYPELLQSFRQAG